MLDGDLDIGKVNILQVGDFLASRSNQGFGYRASVLVEEVLVERTGVHPDPDGDPSIVGLPGNRLDVLLVANVPGVETQTLNPGLQRRQCQAVLEMDIGDDRDGRTRNDLGQALGGIHIVAGDANNIGTGPEQGVDLAEGAVYVGSLGRGHRLHRDRGVSTNGNLAHMDLPGQCARHSGHGTPDQPLSEMGLTMSSSRATENRKSTSAITAAAIGANFRTSASRWVIRSYTATAKCPPSSG